MSNMYNSGMRNARLTPFPVALAAIVALAALLRLWAIDFGLPLVTHPDEPLIVDAAARMVTAHSLNPHWYRYPAFIIDIEAGLLAVVRRAGLDDAAQRRWALEAGRLVMAAFAVATVCLTGVLGRRLARLAGRSRRAVDADVDADIAGLAAAALLAVSFVHVKDAHFLKPDVPTGFFTALTLWCTLNAWERGSLSARQWLAAGVALGLATATKYTGAAAALVPALALALLAGRDLRALLRPLLALSAAAALVFIILNPFAVLTPRAFLWSVDGVQAELTHYATGHDGAEGNDTWRWYILEVGRSGFGALPALLVACGVLAALVVLARTHAGDTARVLALPLAFIVAYYALIARYPVRFDRQLIPALPYLAVVGGFGVAELLHVARRYRGVPRPALLALTLLALLSAPQVARAVRWDRTQSVRDTRYVALDWLEAHVPPGTPVAREWYTPPVAQAGYGDIPVRKTDDQSLAWYRAAGAQYLLLSSFMFQRYLDDPNLYPADAAFYRALLAQPRQVTITGRNGPVVIIMRIDDAAPAFASVAQ